MSANFDTDKIKEEIELLWGRYLDAVVNASLEDFGTFISRDHYIGHMGNGHIEPSREVWMDSIRQAFEPALTAGTAGDQDALQQRKTIVDVLKEDLVLVQNSVFLRDANMNYAISVIFKHTDKGWEAIHSHDSTAPAG